MSIFWGPEWETGGEREDSSCRYYVEGRNAFRDGKERNSPLGLSDLEKLNWEIGYDDMQAEMDTDF